jgi:hypothetical protein
VRPKSMKFFYSILGISLLLLGLLVPQGKAYACSCAGGDALVKLDRSSIVFLGEVIEVGRGTKKGEHARLREYKFELKQSWKGNNNQYVSVFSYDGDSSSCGFEFDKNTTYLVYAGQGKDGTLQTSLCNGNLKQSDAGNDIALLGQSNQIAVSPANHEDGDQGLSSRLLLYGGLILLVVAGLAAWAYMKKRRNMN